LDKKQEYNFKGNLIILLYFLIIILFTKFMYEKESDFFKKTLKHAILFALFDKIY